MPGSIRLEESTIINDLDIILIHQEMCLISALKQPLQDIIRIRNIVGEEIYTEELKEFDGAYTKAISLENYPKAVYFLEIIQLRELSIRSWTAVKRLISNEAHKNSLKKESTE